VSLKLICSNKLSCPISFGSVPSIFKFELANNTVKLDRVPISLGTDPLIILSFISSVTKFVKFPIVVGIVPLMELLASERVCKFVRTPKFDEMLPVMTLDDTSNATKFVKELNQLWGMVPLSTLCAKLSDCNSIKDDISDVRVPVNPLSIKALRVVSTNARLFDKPK